MRDSRVGGPDFLQLAVQANPRFAAAKLELADVLDALGRRQEAQGLTHDALSDARIIGDHYLEATANVLLSRLMWRQGDLSAALRLNAEASRIANDHGHVCAAQVSAAWQHELSVALANPGLRVNEPILASPTLAACQAAMQKPESRWLTFPADDSTAG